MSVTVAPHRVTGEDTLLAACDTCDEATYLAADAARALAAELIRWANLDHTLPPSEEA